MRIFPWLCGYGPPPNRVFPSPESLPRPNPGLPEPLDSRRTALVLTGGLGGLSCWCPQRSAVPVSSPKAGSARHVQARCCSNGTGPLGDRTLRECTGQRPSPGTVTHGRATLHEPHQPLSPHALIHSPSLSSTIASCLPGSLRRATRGWRAAAPVSGSPQPRGTGGTHFSLGRAEQTERFLRATAPS